MNDIQRIAVKVYLRFMRIVDSRGNVGPQYMRNLRRRGQSVKIVVALVHWCSTAPSPGAQPLRLTKDEGFDSIENCVDIALPLSWDIVYHVILLSGFHAVDDLKLILLSPYLTILSTCEFV
jgi:hypothetical protein